MGIFPLHPPPVCFNEAYTLGEYLTTRNIISSSLKKKENEGEGVTNLGYMYLTRVRVYRWPCARHARAQEEGSRDGETHAQHENNAITLLYTNCLWLKHHDDSISILDFEYYLYIPSILFCIQILVIFLDTVF